MIFSDGLPEYGCPNAPPLALGVPLPTVRAYDVAADYAQQGERTLPAAVSSGLNLVRAYGATQGRGYAVLLFNLAKSKPVTVSVRIAHAAKNTYTATETYYDKTIYDASRKNKWDPPVRRSLGTVKPTFDVTLTPWSMTAIVLR